jgi:hypothetical protein
LIQSAEEKKLRRKFLIFSLFYLNIWHTFKKEENMKKTLIFTMAVLMLVTLSAGREFDLSINGGLAINPKWDTAPTFGIIGSTPYNDNITIEGEFFYYMNAQEDFGIEGLSYSSFAWDLNVYALYFFHLANAKFKPYASFGAGVFGVHVKATWDMIWFQGTDTWSKTKFNFGFGGGAKYPLNNKSGLRFDARYIVILGLNGDVIRITAGYYMKLK